MYCFFWEPHKTHKRNAKPGTHYPHVTWAHVILRVHLGYFNFEFWRRLTVVTLLTSRDLTWSCGRLTCQHSSQIPVFAHISWYVTYVSSALQTLLSVVSRNGGNSYWKSAPTDVFYMSPDCRYQHMRANAREDIGKELKIKRETWREDSVCPRLNQHAEF
jgi:hypothetical protein